MPTNHFPSMADKTKEPIKERYVWGRKTKTHHMSCESSNVIVETRVTCSSGNETSRGGNGGGPLRRCEYPAMNHIL